jgi:iron complex outermembrane receptor protein
LSYFQYNLKSQFTLLPAGTVIPIGSDGNVNFATPAGVVAFPEGLIGNPEGDTRNTQFDYTSIYTGFESQRIRINIGAKNQSITTLESKNFGPGILDGLPLPPAVDGTVTNVTDTPYIFISDSSRRVRYLSLQDEWQITPNVNLTTGVRYDNYSDFGGTTNPRIALVWATNKKLTTKLLLGRAFRAPSFSELYQKNNPVSLGRADLQPEQMYSQELSFNYLATEQLQTTLTLFNYQAKNMIDFVDDLSTPLDASKYAENVRDQDGKGFEFEVNWKPSSQLYLSANYSKQQARDAQFNKAIPDAPGQQFKANLNWLFAPEWSLNSQLNWVADRERAQGDLRPAIANYTLLNLTLNRNNILRNLDMLFAVRNATNADAREPSSSTIPDDYPLESRSLWLGLTYSFQ